MKKIVIIILLIIVATGLAILFWPQPTQAPLSENEALVVERESEFTGVDSLQALVDLDDRLECAIQYRPNSEAEEITGTYFVDGEMVRGDFVLTDVTLGEVVSSFISTDDELYVWSVIGGETYGVKTSVSTPAEGVTTPIPRDEPVRYSCKQWVQYDASIFNPPSDVLFRDANTIQAEFGTIYEEGSF
jgi:hypothetical protein